VLTPGRVQLLPKSGIYQFDGLPPPLLFSEELVVLGERASRTVRGTPRAHGGYFQGSAWIPGLKQQTMTNPGPSVDPKGPIRARTWLRDFLLQYQRNK
jgi:hypothetical protein